MTKEEKRERREARHQIATVMRRHAIRTQGLYSTGGQLRAATKVLCDRFYAEQVNPADRAQRQA